MTTTYATTDVRIRPIEISVIVPAHNPGPEIGWCIDALLSQNIDVPFEVVIVDNASTNDFAQNLPTDNRLRIIRESKLGSYAARNAGMAAAQGNVFAFTDADCIPSENWLRIGRDALEKIGHDAVIGGKIELYFRDPPFLTWVEIYERCFAFKRQDTKVDNEVPFLVTANLFVKKHVVEAIGPFNADQYSGGDTEFCQRARESGFPMAVIPDAIVAHPARRSFEELITKKRRRLGAVFTESGVAWNASKVILKIFDEGVILPAKALRSNEVSNIGDRMKAASVSIAVGCSLCAEALRLYFGGKPEHR